MPLFAFGAGVAARRPARTSIRWISRRRSPACWDCRSRRPLWDARRGTVRRAASRAVGTPARRAVAGRTGVGETDRSRPAGGAPMWARQKRALDARFAAIFEAFARNVARTRAPVALWGSGCLVVPGRADGGGLSCSRPTAGGGGVPAGRRNLLTGFPVAGRCSRWFLPRGRICAPPRQRRGGAGVSRQLVHGCWFLSAGAAVALALARNYGSAHDAVLRVPCRFSAGDSVGPRCALCCARSNEDCGRDRGDRSA